MLAVIDTTVFCGTCLGFGAANAVVATCLNSQSTPLMRAALFAEYEDVLQRTALFEGGRLSTTGRDELLDIFMAHCIWTRVYYLWRPKLPEEGDNHLIELAVAGGARHVVTKNPRDLQSMELRFPGLQSLMQKRASTSVRPVVPRAMSAGLNCCKRHVLSKVEPLKAISLWECGPRPGWPLGRQARWRAPCRSVFAKTPVPRSTAARPRSSG